ncbi:hypothetical protein H5410_016177 [Solanum commersonii]|uniref:Uncharacterized protein n=1 Tax=Solanum commersonii TaxID=4109 RepID=A0A9J5ZVR3_SOLCO|nr:hypothetical protein H5410_016177 [Solanum commersonii]
MPWSFHENQKKVTRNHWKEGLWKRDILHAHQHPKEYFLSSKLELEQDQICLRNPYQHHQVIRLWGVAMGAARGCVKASQLVERVAAAVLLEFMKNVQTMRITRSRYNLCPLGEHFVRIG